MLSTERHSIAQRTVSSLGAITPLYGHAGWGELIASRIVTAIAAVDALVMAADHPILIADVLPSIDVIAVRDYTQPATQPTAEGASLHNVWVDGDIGMEWLESLAKLAQDHLNDRSEGAKGAGAFSFPGQDGIYYFMFKAEHRATALRQIGLSEHEVTLVESGVAGEG